MEGQKFSEGKLPLFKVLFEQFPDSVQELVRASKGGHEKYKLTDQNWDNWKKVENGREQYRDAALRHLLLSVKEVFDPNMQEYEPGVRHAAQAIWNIMAFLQLDMDKEEQDRLVGINRQRLQMNSTEAIAVSIEQSKSVNPQKSQTNLDEWMAKHKVENELKYRFESPTLKKAVADAVKSSPYKLTGNRCEKREKEERPIIHFDRPTLTVDQLLNRDDNDKGEEYYPDQEIN